MTTYRIERRDGLLIVHDPIPVCDFGALVAPMMEGGIMCRLCAEALNAVVVAGMPEDIEAERKRLGIGDAADR